MIEFNATNHLLEMEILTTSSLVAGGYLQISLAAAIFYWLFYSRIKAMVDLMSNRVYEAYSSAHLDVGGVKQSSSSLHHHLTQYQLRKRELMSKSKANQQLTYDQALHNIKESDWSLLAECERRPQVGLACSKCTPTSRKNVPETDNLPIVNVLSVQSIAGRPNSFLGKLFPVIRHCLCFKKFKYPYIYESVLQNETVHEVINSEAAAMVQELGGSLSDAVTYQKKRAVAILTKMHSKLSDLVIRISAWVFYKTLVILFRSISVPQSQITMLKRASSSGLPLIFLPLHRSHIDYIAVTFTLCNIDIRSPLVAAGENLNIPVFGSILRGLGAFFIKRRMDPVSGKKDTLYRTLLHNYMTQCLEAGHYFEFFIEGGRTRTGKPCMPKGGLLSVFIDAYLSGILEDALLVPVSVNYEKIVEGNFIHEQTGDPKKPETFGSAISGIWRALNTHYGIVRVDFNQPFSLHELVRTFQSKVRSTAGTLHIAPSTASLYGTDIVVEDQRQLVDSIARHIIYDCSSSTAVMSTNALAFLLLNLFREGVSLPQLIYAMDRLRLELIHTGKDCGFVGESKDVIEHAVDLLGPGLIQKSKTQDGVFLKPVTLLPNVIELSYYSNTLLPHFALNGIVSMSFLYLTKDGKDRVRFDQVMDLSAELCEILQYEFLFTKSCQTLSDTLFEIIDNMVTSEIISKTDGHKSNRVRAGFPRNLDLEDEDDGDYCAPLTTYKVERSDEKLRLYGVLLQPIMETYMVVVSMLNTLLDSCKSESEFIKSVLKRIRCHLESGTLKFGESLSSDTVRSCLKLLEKWSVIESNTESGSKVLYLCSSYNTETTLESLVDSFSRFQDLLD